MDNPLDMIDRRFDERASFGEPMIRMIGLHKTFPGADGPDVSNVWQALSGETELGEKVLLIDCDGHHQATATAEFLADAGKTVHIVTSSLFVGADLGPSQDLYLSRQRLLQKGVTFTPDFAVMEIKSTDSGAEVHGFDVYSNVWDAISGYDSIVTVMGNEVCDDLYLALKNRVPELYRIGDCVAPRKVDMAVHEGYVVGKRV